MELNAGTSQPAQPMCYAVVVRKKRFAAENEYRMDFRVYANDRYCGNLLKALYDLLNKFNQQYLDLGNWTSVWTDTVVEKTLFGNTSWQESRNITFKTALLNKFSKNGWEKCDGISVFDENGITFCTQL